MTDSLSATDLLTRASAAVVGEREHAHGDMLANHLRIAAVWNGILEAAGKLGEPLDAHDVANLMEGLKIARRYTGAFDPDDYLDGAGYAAISGEIRTRMAAPPTEVLPAVRTDKACGSPIALAMQRIEAERQRQEEEEGFGPEHDDRHKDGELLMAARCYYAKANTGVPIGDEIPAAWPWARQWWKPRSPVRDLERAGALVLAERARLSRVPGGVDLSECGTLLCNVKAALAYRLRIAGYGATE